MLSSAIRVDNLSKQYHIGHADLKNQGIREALTNAVTAPLHRLRRLRGIADESETIWALKNVSFEVQPGEVIGIIGRNGAGKSTLLKILSRITDPTDGCVEITGRVASLLEVGTGFHQDLTGRENIYLNGAILGMTRREIERKFDEIVAFSEVEKFIDTPVKRYSSGMQARIAFAVAAHLEPEILIVDEVLAVGDAGFQKKCLGKMEAVGGSGRTVLFVSHNMGMVNSLCQRAVLMDAGRIAMEGKTAEVTQQYVQKFIAGTNASAGQISFAARPTLRSQVLAARLPAGNDGTKDQFDLFEPVTVELDYVIRQESPGMVVAVDVLHQGDILFSSWDADTCPERLHDRKPGTYRAKLQIPAPLLKAGRYYLRCGVSLANIQGIHQPEELLPFDVLEQTEGTSLRSYSPRRPGKLVVPVQWKCSLLAAAAD